MIKDIYQLKRIFFKIVFSSTSFAYLKTSGDPRENGIEFDWDSAYYFEENDKKPRPSEKYIDFLDLKSEYDYLK